MEAQEREDNLPETENLHIECVGGIDGSKHSKMCHASGPVAAKQPVVNLCAYDFMCTEVTTDKSRHPGLEPEESFQWRNPGLASTHDTKCLGLIYG